MNCLFYRRFFKSTKSICIRTWYRKNLCDVLEERAYPFLLLDGGWKISEKWTRTRDMMTSKLRIHECESMYVYYCVCFCVPLVRSIGSLFLFLSLFFALLQRHHRRHSRSWPTRLLPQWAVKDLGVKLPYLFYDKSVSITSRTPS